MRNSVKLFVMLALSALAAAACGTTATVDTTTTTATPLTTLAPTTTLPPTTTEAPTTTTTTTTIPPVLVSDAINGLPADEALINRRAVAIKIDNHTKAQPQSGVMDADVVYEMLVEGGISRFIAVFHQSDSEYLGPVRSGRPTDIGVVRALDAPFQVSGAQPWVKDIFSAAGLRVAYDTGASTWRENHRAAPHNLYGSSVKVRAYADSRGWPDENPGNIFAFGEPTPGDTPATKVMLSWSGSSNINWVWNGEVYERYIGTTPHEVVDRAGNKSIISAPVIVTIVGKKHTVSSPDGSGSPVPTTDTTGSGDAYIFRDGVVIKGRWDRTSYTDPIHLATESGEDLILPPSKMWIVFYPDDRPLTWE